MNLYDRLGATEGRTLADVSHWLIGFIINVGQSGINALDGEGLLRVYVQIGGGEA